MDREICKYLEKDYRYLIKYINNINEYIFVNFEKVMLEARKYAEYLTDEILKKTNNTFMFELDQFQKLKVLDDKGIFPAEIAMAFHAIRQTENKTYDNISKNLERALDIHKNIYEITYWFIKKYIDESIEDLQYNIPVPLENTSSEVRNAYENIIRGSSNKSDYNDSDDALTGLFVEGIFNDMPSKKCLVEQLECLKESSKEAVESLNEFSPFKNYMHVEREAQRVLDNLIKKTHESNKAQIILVCGSVGDGKSHIISYFKHNYPELMNDFILHNDATESFEPNKTSIETLNELLDEFSDEKIENSTQKFILAINLGTLNNFIDSDYGIRFTKLKKFVKDKKILETSITDNSFDAESNFQFVNFSDYHLFTLKDGKVQSKYIKEIIQKITKPSEHNYFYISYKQHCLKCESKDNCPIKANYELLAKENVQNAIIDLIVQCLVKNKIIISTRALLNFIFEIIVPRSYIDINSPTFKNKIANINVNDYVNALMPNTIFNHKELSFIFEALNSLDPLNVRNEKVDDFIIDFNNENDVIKYFKEYIDYPERFLGNAEQVDLNNTENRNLKYELLKLFIRSYYICGKKDLFSLRDEIYDDYMNALFNFNRGDKQKLKNVYENVKKGIMKWNGEAEKDYVNIFIGRNQTKYKVSEKVDLKADTSNLPKNDENDLKKFIGTLNIQYKDVKGDKSYCIDIDYSLYKLLIAVNNGYRPNKKDKNHFIKFIEFISRLEDTGSQNKELLITEKNKENNKQYRLEFDEFETYRFVEI